MKRQERLSSAPGDSGTVLTRPPRLSELRAKERRVEGNRLLTQFDWTRAIRRPTTDLKSSNSGASL